MMQSILDVNPHDVKNFDARHQWEKRFTLIDAQLKFDLYRYFEPWAPDVYRGSGWGLTGHPPPQPILFASSEGANLSTFFMVGVGLLAEFWASPLSPGSTEDCNTS